MDWIELIVHTTSAGSDAVSALMVEGGATGTMTEDRADIPDPSQPHGIWEIIDPRLLENMPEDVLVHGWFSASGPEDPLFAQIREQLEGLKGRYPAYGTMRMEFCSVPDENWAEDWKRFYHPLRAGRHLVIRPSWEDFAPLPGDHVITLDPGMAFGSGYHDTTVLCLELLEDALRTGERVIDVGTGSGILAIGAAMLGAGDVLAVDIDPDAVRVARENAEINGVADRIRIQEGDLLEKVEETCDICVANIIADIVLKLAGPLKKHIRPGGLFICSGIILERRDEIRSALTEAGYTIEAERVTEEWAAFSARRPV